MRKVFWDDPYQTILDTAVIEIQGNEILFKETIAYSFAGGQESDKATINGIPIVTSRKAGINIYYTLPEGHGLSAGEKVTMEIDWSRRLKLMRLHFACELVLVIVNRLFGRKKPHEELVPEEIDIIGPEKTGAHMAETHARVDFKLDENIGAYLPAIQEEYRRIIDADLPIEKGFIDEERQLRYWRIKGFATVPCGGTHVRSTAEVGMAIFKRDRVGKGVERIRIEMSSLS